MKYGWGIACWILCAHGIAVSAQAQMEPLRYHHPGLMVDLGVGLWAWPLPMDFDGDGDLDLIVNCPDKPSNGVFFFENVSGDTATHPLPVFKPGKWISQGLQNVQVSYVENQPVVLTPGKIYPDFTSSGLSKPKSLPLPAQVYPGKTRANMWRMVDFDGDGLQDIVVGAGYWGDYGWDNAYNAQGDWINGPLHGFVYFAKNKGTNDAPRYAEPVQVQAGDAPVDVYGWPSPNFADFDGDGDLDLLCGEFLDGFTYFENIGTRTAPQYAPGKRLLAETGQPLRMDLQMITPVAIDWNQNGALDLIVGDEDGRVAFVENTGKLTSDRLPIFREPVYFQQEADTLKFGALSTPVGYDWDGDGDMDILAGNTAGYIGYFENLSGAGVEPTKWAAPRLLSVAGKPIRIQAGPNGSIQGPAEAKWGYTTLTVSDWDGDGLPDLLVNSIWGKVVWYRNKGPRDQPQLEKARPIDVEWPGKQPELSYGWLKPEGKALLTQWRTTPVAVDWNRDGLMDLVMLDHEGYLAYFERYRQGDQLLLHPPRRVFCNEQEKPLQLNSGIAGRSGRRKLCIVDWDGDGRLDVIVNSENASLFQQVGEQNGKWLFADKGLLDERKISGHTTSPTVIDLSGSGIPDLLVGAEDGLFYFKKNPRAGQNKQDR
ncbi:MAG: VCBS repeat-containing protein [Planctomycetaceae bacterium]